MALIILAFFIVPFLTWIMQDGKKVVQKLYRQTKQKIWRSKYAPIFETNYIEVKAFYVREHNAAPCISFINNLDVAKAYEYINKGFAGEVLAIYQRNYYS